MAQSGSWVPDGQPKFERGSLEPRDIYSNESAAGGSRSSAQSQLSEESSIEAYTPCDDLPHPAWKPFDPPSFNQAFPSFSTFETDPFRDSSDPPPTPASYLQSESSPFSSLTPETPRNTSVSDTTFSTSKARQSNTHYQLIAPKPLPKRSAADPAEDRPNYTLTGYAHKRRKGPLVSFRNTVAQTTQLFPKYNRPSPERPRGYPRTRKPTTQTQRKYIKKESSPPTPFEAFALARSTPNRRSTRGFGQAAYHLQRFQAPTYNLDTAPRSNRRQSIVERTYQGDINNFERRDGSLIIVIQIQPYFLRILKQTGLVFPISILVNRATELTSTYPRAIKRFELIYLSKPPDKTKDMAPGYRTQNRRQNRTGYVDHDVFEGLPVRQWRRDLVNVAPQPEQENSKAHNDIWAVELPHGMPKDSHLLPQHSQDLLRAARSGRIYKRPPPVEEEEIDPEVSEKQEKKEDESKDRGFSARAWKQIPRQQEGPDIEYLAKRRKGLVTYTKPAPPVPTVVRTTVRRTDAAGNQYTQDVVVPHGQQVDGEVVSQIVIPDPSAAPTTNSFVPQPTPPRPKKPVQRKKTKGPGRGKKKKPLPPTSVPQVAPIDGAAPVGDSSVPVVGADGISIEGEPLATPVKDEDTEMGEGSMAASDDEDGDEDGDEGDDDEGSVVDQNSPSKPPRPESPIAVPLPTMKEIPDLNPAIGFMPSGHLLLAHLERQKSEGTSGSPLKNVALATSASTSPVVAVPPPFPDIVSTNEPAVNPSSEAVIETTEIPKIEHESLDDAMQLDIAEIEIVEEAPPVLPSPPEHPTNIDLKFAEEVRKAEEEEEGMLLDIVENSNNVEIGGEALLDAPAPVEVVPEVAPLEQPMAIPEALPEAFPEALLEVVTEVPIVETSSDPPVEEPVAAMEEPKQVSPEEKEAPEPINPLMTEPTPPPQQTANDDDDDDDDFPDLLGGLEKSLNLPPPATLPEKPKSPPGAELPGDAENCKEEEKPKDDSQT